jgi:hypothetical protein
VTPEAETHASAFDFTTGQTAVVFQDKPVVYLSPWLARSYMAAVAERKRFVVLTPSGSRLTHPLAHLLSTAGSQWLATTSDGRFFDGFTGRIIAWADGEFRAGEEVAEDFLLTPAVPRGHVHVHAETLHPASLGTRVGVLAERVFQELTGAAPEGWGLHEPVSEGWDVEALTAHCFDRSPRTSHIVVLGRPRRRTTPVSIAMMRVERSSAGVHETVEFLAESEDPLSGGELDAFGSAMHHARVRTALLGHGLGYTELGRPARFTGMSVPGCAVFGPEAVRTLGAQKALDAAGPGARLVGVAPAQSLLVAYPHQPVAGQPHPLEAYGALAAKLAGTG